METERLQFDLLIANRDRTCKIDHVDYDLDLYLCFLGNCEQLIDYFSQAYPNKYDREQETYFLADRVIEFEPLHMCHWDYVCAMYDRRQEKFWVWQADLIDTFSLAWADLISTSFLAGQNHES